MCECLYSITFGFSGRLDLGSLLLLFLPLLPLLLDLLEVFLPCLEHVAVKENHSDDDASVDESEAVVVEIGYLGMPAEVVVEDQGFNDCTERIEEEEGVVAQVTSDGCILEEVVQIAVNLGNRPHDHHTRILNPSTFGLHHVKSHNVPAQNLKEGRE
jgi:hypothetical protein